MSNCHPKRTCLSEAAWNSSPDVKRHGWLDIRCGWRLCLVTEHYSRCVTRGFEMANISINLPHTTFNINWRNTEPCTVASKAHSSRHHIVHVVKWGFTLPAGWWLTYNVLINIVSQLFILHSSQHNCTGLVHRFLCNYTTCFGCQFQPSSGGNTGSPKSKRGRSPPHQQ